MRCDLVMCGDSTFGALLAAIAMVAVTGSAQANDISRLTDFGTSEIPRQEAFITQVGDSNYARVDQAATPGNTGHYAEITQTGAANEATATQTGNLNRAKIIQDGYANVATTSQDGLRNSIDIAQSGSLNRLTGMQVGNDNSIVATQTSGAQATLSEIGNNNTIISTQSLTNLNVSVRITGNGMTVNIQ